jgi:large subunit ribosomal protein L22
VIGERYWFLWCSTHAFGETGDNGMPNWAYSVEAVDRERSVRCSGRELRISPKAATEICRTIKGMRIEEAKKMLEEVVSKKRPIAYRRYKTEVPHKSHSERWHAGRYPSKAAAKILELLEELQSNAEYKGLDIDRLRIVHAASQRGMKTRNYTPRAFGRSSPSLNILTHVELIGYEAQS